MAKGNVLLRPSEDEHAALSSAVARTRLSKAEIYRQALALWLHEMKRGQLTDALVRAGYLSADGQARSQDSPWDEIMQGGS